MAKDAPGMRGIRSRNPTGPLRRKRSDAHVNRIEKRYKKDFGVRGDMHLDELLRRRGKKSLNDLINDE